MKYELAKRLKDAGFTQDYGDEIAKETVCGENGCLPVPTLSELIEACGGYVDLMVWNNVKAVAVNIDSIEGRGSTPEEAVAELYLKLNSKQ